MNDDRFEYEEYNSNEYDYEPVIGEREYYRKIEKRTTSGNVGGRYKKYISYTNKNGSRRNEYEVRNSSFSSNQRRLKGSRPSSSKQQYSFAGKVREKNNYVYYVSGIGYVNKNDEKPKKKERNIIRSKPNSQVIKIVTKKDNSTSRQELVDNYQYHETKDIKRQSKKTTVTHKRLCEPFYQTVYHKSKKRNSSYTPQPKIYQVGSYRSTEEYEAVEPKRTLENIYNSRYNNNDNSYAKYDLDKYSFFSSRQGSQSTKNYGYNFTSLKKRIEAYKKRDSEENKKSYIPSGYNKYKKLYERKYEEKKNREFNSNNSYNNIKRHEIKVMSNKSKDKNLNKSSYLGNESQNRKYYENTHQRVRQQRIVKRNSNKKNEYTSTTQNNNKEIKGIYGYEYNLKDIQKPKEVYKKNREYYPSEDLQHTEIIYQNDGKIQNIPHHIQQVQNYQRNRKENQNIPQQVYEYGIYENQRFGQNIPQQVKEIEFYDRGGSQNIPQQVQQIQVYEENADNYYPQQVIEYAQESYENNDERFTTQENIQQNDEYYQLNTQQYSNENTEQNDEYYQQNRQKIYSQEKIENNEDYNQNIKNDNPHENIEQNREYYQSNYEENYQEYPQKNDNQKEEEYYQQNKIEISQENVEQKEEINQDSKDIIQNENEKQEDIKISEKKENNSQEILDEDKKEFISQENIQESQDNIQENKKKITYQENAQQNEEGFHEERKEYDTFENKEMNQNEGKEFSDYQENIGKNEVIYDKEKMKVYTPIQNNENNEVYYEEERKQYIPKQNINHQGIYQGERKGFIPQQKYQRVNYINKDGKNHYVSQGNLEPSKYQERRRIYSSKENIQQNNYQDYSNDQNIPPNEQIYNEFESGYIPQQNIQKTQEMYKLEYIPQENIQQFKNNYNRNKEYYNEERNEYSNNYNNRRIFMDYGKEFCPIHGSRFNNFYSNQIYKSNNQIKKDGRNQYSQNIYHTHEEMNGMVGDTNNYKFYESKNIKNEEGDINSMTFHHIRGEQKERNSKGLNNYSNVYAASKAIPIIHDSNYKEYQSFSQINSSYNNYVGQSNNNSPNESYGFYAVPNNLNLKIQESGY